MITTAGLAVVATLSGNTSTADFAWIAYGSGATAETAGETALVTEIGRVAATITTSSILKPNDTVKFSANVTVTAAGTVAEIGVFTAATGGTMLQRKLLVPSLTYKINDTLSLIVTVTVKNYAYQTGASW